MINSILHRFDPQYFIIAVVAFSQGFQNVADLPIQYLLKDDYDLSPVRMGLYLSYVTIPWLIKPLWGLITDSKPLFGYRRKSYIILFGALDSLGWICLAQYGQSNLYVALIILFMIHLSTCFVNVVGEAVMVEIASKAGDDIQSEASKSVSYFWGLRGIGFLISAYYSGWLLTILSKKQSIIHQQLVFLITAVFPALLAVVSFFYDEPKVNYEILQENDRRISSIQCIKDFWSFFQNPLIYKPVGLIFCFMMTPSSSSIMFFFYTQVLHFTPTFMGQLKFLYAFSSIMAILLYNQWLKNISFKRIFGITTLVYYLCYQSQIILVTRYNRQLGINDKIFSIGDSVMLQFVAELNIMPILVFSCRMCPKNIEATMYSMLMSSINFGSTMGAQWGALLLNLLQIDRDNYDNLWIFMIISGICMILPLFWLNTINEDISFVNEQNKLPKYESMMRECDDWQS